MKHLVYPGFLDFALFARFLQSYARAAVLNVLRPNEMRALPDYAFADIRLHLAIGFARTSAGKGA
jgi:hypothetical protein